jgi:hypothetical protein
MGVDEVFRPGIRLIASCNQRTIHKISPNPSFTKRGNVSPFAKGGLRGILNATRYKENIVDSMLGFP